MSLSNPYNRFSMVKKTPYINLSDQHIDINDIGFNYQLHG